MIINFNIGLLGHVDSGKTSLARVLSSISSTAAFDKNPQSKQRGITLDLGFSALLVDVPAHIKALQPDVEQLQFAFVDCPGHASLIRTIIGGAQIIDMMILVIDAQKGIQTQTAECIVIGELLKRKLVVVVNKIDLLQEQTRDEHLSKLHVKLRKVLGKTTFGANVGIFNVSAQNQQNIQELLAGLCAECYLPTRKIDAPLLIYVDHCFSSAKLQGTVCTGTIVQGKVAVNEVIELPSIHEQRKVKSIQMFHRAMQAAAMGDRVGLCVTQFNAKKFERGVITQPGYLKSIYGACISVQRIKYYSYAIKSKSKLHITIGHNTVMANITLFRANGDVEQQFDVNKEYEFIDELPARQTEDMPEPVFALLEFETPILAAVDAILIASKLDMDIHGSSCRIAFWGHIQWLTTSINYAKDNFTKFKIFKRKLRQGTVQRIVNANDVIVQNLFKKESNRDIYVGKHVELSTGEHGIIDSTFGKTSKVKVHFPNGLNPDTLNLLNAGKSHHVSVLLKFKKNIFNKNFVLIQ